MTTQLIQRKRYDPHWTEVEYKPAGGRDFLGIETLSESILADLLPGINNQTRRARYYSFWAWVLRDFINDPDATHTQPGLYQWLRGREDTLILAYLAHGCDSGLAGTIQGNKFWADGSLKSYPIDWKSLESVSGGAYQLYYRGALQAMNIIASNENSPHDDLTETVGLNLADAYAQFVAKTQFVTQYLHATRLSKAVIEDFAQAGCVCQLHQSQAERRHLIDSFFRFDSPDVYAVKRLASLCFFLDIIAQSQGEPLAEYDFRAVLYFWSFGQHHAYQPAGNLLSPAQRWRIFQLRQYFVFAIQSMWSLFLNQIYEQTLSDEAYLAWLLSELGLAGLAKEMKLTLPTTDATVLPLKTFFEAVRTALPRHALDPGPTAFKTDLNEHMLTFPIWDNKTELDVQVRAGNAMLILVLIYWRCQPWRTGPGWIYVSDQYAAGRHPIESYLRHVEQAFAENWSLARWLGWFHHHYLWLQHRRVVLEKLIARGQDTAKFELLDALPHEIQTSGQPARAAYFRGLGIDWPKMNGPRFPSALNIMTDLELIAPTGQTGYKLTRTGQSLLQKFRSYTVPDWEEPEDYEVDEDAAPSSG